MLLFNNKYISLIFSSIRLIPELECVDVPKEVCVRVRNNPKKIKKPIVKRWCYTPTETETETGSADDSTETASNNNGAETETNTETIVPDAGTE